jgi:hypothetical protein
VEREGPSVGKVGEWNVESWHLQGCSPCLCWLRTDGLALASKYWTYWSHTGVMGLVSWGSCVTTWSKPLSPTPRLSWGRKNEVTWDDGRASLSWSPRLLLCVGACFILVETSERLPTWTTGDVWSGPIRESSMESVWHVDGVFPCMVYIDSNRRNSRIWVSLVCDSHHVDNLTILMSLSIIDVGCLMHLIICNSYLSRVGCTLLWNDLNRSKTWK